MKMAKIYVMMFALFLAVFCLSGSFAFGGDEHPWDEEGGIDGGGLDGVAPEPGADIPIKIGSGTATPSDGSAILTFLEFTLVASTVL